MIITQPSFKEEALRSGWAKTCCKSGAINNAQASEASRAFTVTKPSPGLYSDQAITCALRLREVYRLPLRATEGLLRSLIALLVQT